MLEIKEYKVEELKKYFQTTSRQGLERKMERYGIEYTGTGRGDDRVYSILTISDPLLVFFVFDLGLDPHTDFKKMRDYLYFCFNDEEFSAMPFEVQEKRIKEMGFDISRQTMSKIMHWFEHEDYIARDNENAVYYFANKDAQIITEKDTYKEAWRKYWENVREKNLLSVEAIDLMKAEYGGVAKKHGTIAINGIYGQQMELLNNLIIESVMKEQEGFSQSINTKKE